MATKTGHTVGKKSKTVVGKSNKSNDGGKKQPHHSFHKKPLFIGGGIAALLLLVILIAVSLVSSRSISAFNLISDYAKKADYIEDVIKTDDPDGIMGSSHMYTSKSSWEDSRLNDIVEAHAGTDEVFRNSKDAELREWYLDKTSEACIKHIAAAKYGKDLYEQICGSLGYGTTYRNQTVIVRLSRSLTEVKFH